MVVPRWGGASVTKFEDTQLAGLFQAQLDAYHDDGLEFGLRSSGLFDAAKPSVHLECIQSKVPVHDGMDSRTAFRSQYSSKLCYILGSHFCVDLKLSH